MPGRKFDTDEYRYGFQGQEKDDEIKGEGNSVNYKYRMNDPRLGRFFAVDPLASEYPHNSPYAFSENRVIDGVELEGLEFEKYLNAIKQKVTQVIVSTAASVVNDVVTSIKNTITSKVDETGESMGVSNLSDMNLQEFHLGMKAKVKLGPAEGSFGPEVAVGNSSQEGFTENTDINMAGRFKAEGSLGSKPILEAVADPSNWTDTGIGLEVYAGFTIDDEGTVNTDESAGVSSEVSAGGDLSILGNGGNIKAKSDGNKLVIDATVKVGVKASGKAKLTAPEAKVKAKFTGSAKATDR